MKIKIDKEFFGVYDAKNAKIKIELTSEDDVLFFARWSKLNDGLTNKKDYVKEISFETITREGKIANTFPLLGINEDFVELSFDTIEVNWKEF